MAWFFVQYSAELYLTDVSRAEMRAGVARLRLGQHRDRPAAEANTVVRENNAARVLTFDSAAARTYATIAAARRSLGRPILRTDCRIARSRSAGLGNGPRRLSRPARLIAARPWFPTPSSLEGHIQHHQSERDHYQPPPSCQRFQLLTQQHVLDTHPLQSFHLPTLIDIVAVRSLQSIAFT